MEFLDEIGKAIKIIEKNFQSDTLDHFSSIDFTRANYNYYKVFNPFINKKILTPPNKLYHILKTSKVEKIICL